MLTQKAMLRIAEIKGWTLIRGNTSTLDLGAGRAYAQFTFKEHPTFKCQVAFSRVQAFQDKIATLCTKEEQMLCMDTHKRLNEDDKFYAELDIEEVAAKIIIMNYGVHRLLSALVRQILIQRPTDGLAIGIRALLEKGLF